MIPQWMRKCLVACVAVLTFGMVVPTLPAHDFQKSDEKQRAEDKNTGVAAADLDNAAAVKETAARVQHPEDTKQALIHHVIRYATDEAQKQGAKKFGTKISRRITGQYTSQVVPVFTGALKQVSSGKSEAWIRALTVTDNPAPGLGERIVHVYNKQTGREVLLLHVRRDHLPLDGYYFNFHYHTAMDGFQIHHEIKTIYWGKNMPPKWQA